MYSNINVPIDSRRSTWHDFFPPKRRYSDPRRSKASIQGLNSWEDQPQKTERAGGLSWRRECRMHACGGEEKDKITVEETWRTTCNYCRVTNDSMHENTVTGCFNTESGWHPTYGGWLTKKKKKKYMSQFIMHASQDKGSVFCSIVFDKSSSRQRLPLESNIKAGIVVHFYTQQSQ